MIPVAQTILYHSSNHQLRPVVFLPAGTLPPGLVTDILGYLQNEIVRFLHCWMRLIVSFPTTPTSTIFHARVFGHLVRTSSVVTSSTSLLSVFSSGWLRLQLSREHPKVSPYSLSVAMQGYESLLFHHNWPLGSLLEGLGRGFLRIECVYSSRSCTHRFLSLERSYTAP